MEKLHTKKLHIAFISVVIAAAFLFAACSASLYGAAEKYSDNLYLDNGIIEEGAEVENPGENEPIGEIGEEAKEPDTPKTKLYILTKVRLTVRSGASTSYAALGQIESGELIAYRGIVSGWYKTVYKGGDAYVSADKQYSALYSMNIFENEKVEEVIEVGETLIGFPYVYGAVRLHGGNGTIYKTFVYGKFDCSSLTQYIFYYGAKVNLDTVTRTQIKQGVHVDKANLKRGDLMFFTNSSRMNLSGIERVGHVAVYLGDNYILHTASTYAKIEKISSTRWSYYIESRRMI
jgi:cell wall-associated NlpC family hydrolase